MISKKRNKFFISVGIAALLVSTLSCSSKPKTVDQQDEAAVPTFDIDDDDDEIAYNDRNANLPTLFDNNQADIRNERQSSSKYSDPNAYSDRPGRRG